jgi:hypothetical protein
LAAPGARGACSVAANATTIASGLASAPFPYERVSTPLTSNRPVDDWGKLLGDTAAVTALLDRLLHHAHVLKCGPRSWRTKVQADLRAEPTEK